MMALNLILALLAAGAVTAVVGLGFFAGASRSDQRSTSVAELPAGREPELEAA